MATRTARAVTAQVILANEERATENLELCTRNCYRRRHHGSVVLPFRIPGAAGKASAR
jgi:hypothetical protein